MNRKFLRVFCIAGILVLLVGTMLVPSFAKTKGFTIAMVVKGAGNPFFEACKKGGEEAVGQLGDKLIFQGPETPTAEGQIAMIDALIAQRVDAITISANDANALVPVCQKAMKRGIKVITFDSAVAPAGRDLFLNQCDMEQVGRIEVQMLGEMIDYKGDIAILSSASTHTNQNTWIKWMKEELKLPKYKEMNLVAVVYGDDLREKSYNEALGLFKSYPNLKGIISPTTVGIAATARALEDKGLNGKIQLTGLGLPSEMAEYIRNGTCKAMALWNPIDLGYVSTYMAHRLLSKENKGKIGETVDCGRMGKLKIVDEGNGGKMIILGPPFQFNAKNINDWYKVY
ncbi:MAG: rhamnose ABC transporter substrate-binding protein [Bacillota bacterium]